MKRASLIFVILLVGLATFALRAQDDAPVTAHDGPPSTDDFVLVEVVRGLQNPLFVTGAGDGSGRLFVVEQAGRIWIVRNDVLQNTPFINLSNIVSQDVLSGYSERGLLGLAFHPDFAENGVFFVNYTQQGSGTTHVARYTVSADNPDVADPNSAEVIFTISQPYSNHNGGHMAFGPDGYLYVSIGDGGSANDPLDAGQDPASLYGTIIRIDVDDSTGDRGYGIPADNPFTFIEDVTLAPEIWAWGLRNVWRFSFDRATGAMYHADVGQNVWEEVNYEGPDHPGGSNYGWVAYEGPVRYRGEDPVTEVVMPVASYEHRGSDCSVTGGYVYRGERIPALQGYYFYSDYCSGTLRALWRDDTGAWSSSIVMETNMNVSSFGEDDESALYIVGYDGTLLRFEAPAQ